MTVDSDIRVRRDIMEVKPPRDQEWFLKKTNESRKRMIENRLVFQDSQSRLGDEGSQPAHFILPITTTTDAENRMSE
jgi:hypothetical protein